MDFWSLISIAVTIGLTKAARTSTNKLLFLIKSEDFIEQVPETNLKSADKTTVVASMDFKRTLNQAVISYPHYQKVKMGAISALRGSCPPKSSRLAHNLICKLCLW